MTTTTHIDEIAAALTGLEHIVAERKERLDRVGAYMDDPNSPTIIFRVKHGKILDFEFGDGITQIPADQLQSLLNGVIFGAFMDWFNGVQPE